MTTAAQALEVLDRIAAALLRARQFNSRPLSEDESGVATLRQHIDSTAAELEAWRHALDMLAGLHPGLTTTEPAAMAQAIFDAVLAERSELRRKLDEARKTIEWQYNHSAGFAPKGGK